MYRKEGENVLVPDYEINLYKMHVLACVCLDNSLGFVTANPPKSVNTQKIPFRRPSVTPEKQIFMAHVSGTWDKFTYIAL